MGFPNFSFLGKIIKALELITENLLQNLAQPDGMSIYQDTDGVNLKDRWFIPDNTPNSKLRPIQLGRGYSFTGTQYVTIPTSAVQYLNGTTPLRFSFLYKHIPSGTLNAFSALFSNLETPANSYKGFDFYSGGSNMGTRSNKFVFSILKQYTGGNWISLISSTTLIANEIYDVEVVYDGSLSSSGITMTVNGVVQSLIHDTGSSTSITGPIVGSNTFTLGKRTTDGSSSHTSNLFRSEMYANGLPVFKYYHNEGGGLICYDSSGNGSHGSISLGGGAESSFHTTNILVPNIQNTIGHGVKSAVTNDSSYLYLPSANLKPAYWELEVTYKYELFDPNYSGLLSINSNAINDGIVRQSDGVIYARMIAPMTSTQGRSGLVLGTVYTDTWKYTATQVIANGIVKSNGTYAAMTYGSLNVLIGRSQNGSYPNHQKQIFGFKWWECNASGTRIKELVNLDFSTLNTTGVKNIGADAPVGTEWAKWTTARIAIAPINESNPNYDVLGNLVPDNYKGVVRREAQVRLSNCAYFNGVSYATIPSKDELKLTNVELIIEFTKEHSGTKYDLLLFEYVYLAAGGFWVQCETTGVISCRNGQAVIQTSAVANSIAWNTLKLSVINGIFYVHLNGDLQGSVTAQNSYQSSGRLSYAFGWANTRMWKGGAKSYLVNELDNSGAFVSNLVKYNFSEGAGLTVYNTAANRPANSDMTVVLNGAADGTQWTTSDYARPTNLIGKFNNKLYFNGSSTYGRCSLSFESSPMIELEVRFIKLKTTRIDLLNNTGNTSLLRIEQSPTQSVVIIGSSGIYWTSSMTTNIWYTLRVINDASTIRIYVNGILEHSVQYLVGASGFLVNTVGIFNDFASNRHLGAIDYLKISSVDSSGNVIKRYVDYRFTDKTNVIQNKAIDKLANSDLYVYGTINHMYIPEDVSNIGFDFIGNQIENIGNGKQIIPSESKFNRNALSNPELFAAGLATTEAAAYEEIIGNTTRLYDKDGNVVSKMLSYSDIKEPIGGGFLAYRSGNSTSITRASSFIHTVRARVRLYGSTFNSSFWIPVYSVGRTMDTGSGYNVFWNESDKTIRARFAGGLELAVAVGYSILNKDVIIFSYSNGSPYLYIGVYDLSSGGYFNGGQNQLLDMSNNTMELGRCRRYNSFLNGDFYSFEYTTSLADANQIKDYNTPLPSLTTRLLFSESKGLTSYNIAQDRTSGDATHVLNAIPETSIWGLTNGNPYKHELTYGYYRDASGVDIPGDPYNPGFAVNGQPINNQSEVTKYNKVRKYLDQ